MENRAAAEMAGRPRERASKAKTEPPTDADEAIGYWTRHQLIDMDIRFCMRMRRAIDRGLERPHDEPMRRAG